MTSMKRVLVLYILLFATIVFATPTAQADEGATRQTTQQGAKGNVQGLKGAALAKALQAMAKVLRKGNGY